MGGYGSGSNTRFAAKTSDYRKIDLSGFNRVRPGERTIGTLIWSRGGERRASIGYVVTTRALRVHYTVTSRGEDMRVDEEFPFDFTRQHFGGERRWFLCPVMRASVPGALWRRVFPMQAMLRRGL